MKYFSLELNTYKISQLTEISHVSCKELF